LFSQPLLGEGVLNATEPRPCMNVCRIFMSTFYREITHFVHCLVKAFKSCVTFWILNLMHN